MCFKNLATKSSKKLSSKNIKNGDDSFILMKDNDSKEDKLLYPYTLIGGIWVETRSDRVVKLTKQG